MTDREIGLLRAVCADPADDAPRLILADWWDEHGRPERAEFLRVQCAAAYLSACGHTAWPFQPDDNHGECRTALEATEGCEDCSRLITLCARSRALLTATKPGEWSGFPAELASSRALWQFRRGFVASLTLSAAHWLRHADALYWHPTQTEACGACDGIGRVKIRAVVGKLLPRNAGRCLACNSTGRVPRPFPPTAQPIEAVRLRTWPDFTDYTFGQTGVASFRGRLQRHALDLLSFCRGDGGVGGALLAAEWPHVRFESLAESAAHYSREATAT
jgi:uncharacterized protein (TIGR02996 family)